MPDLTYFNEVPFSVTICDKNGVVLEMNDKSSAIFAKDGGRELIGKSLLGCHSPRDQRRILDMVASQCINVYTIEKDGQKKLIYQCPWYENGEVGGLIELSIVIPEQMPHFLRGSKMIYHITSQSQWQKALKEGRYLPENYEKDGFIHCSKKEQVVTVGNSFYANLSGLILLSINIEKLDPRPVYENTSGGEELFPHLYSPLPLQAVEFTAPFQPNESGSYEFPAQWDPCKA